MSQSTHNRDPRRRRKRIGDQKVFEEIIAENFPNLRKEIDIWVLEAEGPKQDEPKQTYTKTL